MLNEARPIKGLSGSWLKIEEAYRTIVASKGAGLPGTLAGCIIQERDSVVNVGEGLKGPRLPGAGAQAAWLQEEEPY
jgi:hypothetical protein